MAALSGKLSDFEIQTIMQFIKTSGKNGILKISAATSQGEIHFKNLSMVYAVDQEKNTGEVALFNLFRLKEGEFSFVPTEEVKESAINIPIDKAHLSLQEKLKEWEEITNKIPDLNMIVSLIPDPETKEVKIDPSQWEISAQINDLKSIRQLASTTSYSLLDTAKIVYSLIISGLAEVNISGGKQEIEKIIEPELPVNETKVDIETEADLTSKSKRPPRKKKKGFFKR